MVSAEPTEAEEGRGVVQRPEAVRGTGLNMARTAGLLPGAKYCKRLKLFEPQLIDKAKSETPWSSSPF